MMREREMREREREARDELFRSLRSTKLVFLSFDLMKVHIHIRGSFKVPKYILC